MSSIMPMEGKVNKTIHFFLKRLEVAFIQTGKVCPADLWLQILAFEAVSQMTYSNYMGFLEQGNAIDGMLAGVDEEFYYYGIVNILLLIESAYIANKTLGWSNAMVGQASRQKPIVSGNDH